MSSDNLFHSAVDAVFQNWTSLQFAVDQGAAGHQSVDIAKWMVSTTVQWFSDNKNLENDEVEDFLLDTINQEFDVLIDDNSVTVISELVCDFYRLCSSTLSRGDCEAEIKRRLQALPKCDLSKWKVDFDEEEENIEQTTTTTNESMDIDEQPKPEEQDPDGWTVVKPRKKSGDTIVSNRTERRRQKILQNADDRMRKICGGQNYHEEYLKTPSTAIANEDITPFVKSSDQVHDVKRGTFWIFWFIFGVMIRLVGTSKYSCGICDSSFMPYGLTFTILNFLIPVKQHQGSAGAILAFLGLCAGLDANKIASMKFALSIVSEFLKTLITYYVGFMLSDVVITNI